MRSCGLRPSSSLDQKVLGNRPPFFVKMGFCFLQLFDPSTSKASNRDPMACNYIMRMKKYIFGKMTKFS